MGLMASGLITFYIIISKLNSRFLKKKKTRKLFSFKMRIRINIENDTKIYTIVKKEYSKRRIQYKIFTTIIFIFNY